MTQIILVTGGAGIGFLCHQYGFELIVSITK